MSVFIKRIIAAIVRLTRGSRAMNDFSDYPLPLYMRQSAGLPPPEPPKVVACSDCGGRYFERTTGSFIKENGKCRACATTPAAATVSPFRRAKARGGR